MKSFTEYLAEATFDISDDAQLIYETFFEEIVNQMKTSDNFVEVPRQHNISSSVLRTPIAKQAHELNPCSITVWAGDNAYIPTKKLIRVGINSNVIDMLVNNGSIKQVLGTIPKDLHKQYISEFDEHRIVGSIAHELSHWVDDTLHNQHIAKRIVKAKEEPSLSKKNRLHSELASWTSAHEINAQIHAIKEIKNRIDPAEWEQMTFNDVVIKNASLQSFKERMILNDPAKYTQWKRLVIKRLYREGMLGKHMR